MKPVAATLARELLRDLVEKSDDGSVTRKVAVAMLAAHGLIKPYHLTNAIRSLGYYTENARIHQDDGLPSVQFAVGKMGRPPGQRRKAALEWVRARLPCSYSTLMQEAEQRGHTTANVHLALAQLDPMIENKSSTVIDW